MTSTGCEDAARAVRPPQTLAHANEQITATLQHQMGSVTYFDVFPLRRSAKFGFVCGSGGGGGGGSGGGDPLFLLFRLVFSACGPS